MPLKKHAAKARSRRPSPNGASAAADPSFRSYFSKFAQGAARATGSPAAFLLASGSIVVWGITGPVFGYSDTWQLVINTSTTIVTFLMVFLIQNTQNRDSLAVQLKLAELIVAMRGAKNKIATVEEMSDDELELLHQELCKQAHRAHDTLQNRRRRT